MEVFFCEKIRWHDFWKNTGLSTNQQTFLWPGGGAYTKDTAFTPYSIKMSWLIRGQLKNCMKNCTKCIAINWVFEFTWVDSKYRFLFGLSTVWLLPYCSIWFFFHHSVIEEVFMLRLSARIWISGRWKLN